MHPVVFFRIFPFLFIPHRVALPTYFNQPYHLRSPSVYHTTYRHRSGFPMRRDFQPQNPYAIHFAMTYPATSLASARTVSEGDNCFTDDGRLGVCRQKFQCDVYTHYASIYAEKITTCGQRGQSAFICCPEGQAQKIPNLNAKPIAPAATMSKTSPTEQTLPYTSFVPDEKANNESSIKFMTEATSSPEGSAPTATAVPKDKDTSNTNRIPMIVNGFDFITGDTQKVCGVYDSKSSHQNGNSWPWIVSIGRTHSNNTIEWFCLGSLITSEYILTTAHCLQGSPTVTALGQSYIGTMTANERENVVLHRIAESFQYDKFVFPAMYKNVGLIRIQNRTEISAKILPVCFPFLAGVLDIINFAGAEVQTMGFQYPERYNKGMINQFEIAEYRVFNNSLCSKVVQTSPSDNLTAKLPKGVKSDVMCAFSKTKPPLCPVAGAPIIILDKATDSYVVIGLSMGDLTCVEFQRKIMFSTRVNSYSAWVRDHVREFPSPPPCYI